MASFKARSFNIAAKYIVKPLIARTPVSPEGILRTQQIEQKRGKKTKLPSDFHREELHLRGVPSIILQEKSLKIDQKFNDDASIILYLHGGGYVVGSIGTYQALTWRISKACKMPIALAGYRLAPQHTFPAAPEDAVQAYLGLLELGYKTENIVIMGDSAGGNLTLSTLLRLREIGVDQPACAVVISPWSDLSNSGESVTYNSKHDPYVPGYKMLDAAARLYAGDTPLDHPHLSPVFADYTGLAPLKVVVGGLERFLDDAKRTASAASRDGVEVELNVWADMGHVFPLFSLLPEAKSCLEDISIFISRKTVNKSAKLKAA